jgi:phospholipid/cholesterol/gamma-HCH transport system substrate-binding protein
LIDIRSFQVVMSPDPVADVELSAKILGEGGRIVDARIFHATAPVAKLEPVPAVTGFNQAFGKVATDLVMWAVGLI